MKSFELKAEKRANIGSKFAKVIRKEGNVPCVIYGNGEHMDIVVSAKELAGAINTPEVFVINVNLEGKVIPCIIKDMQFHPVSDEPMHIDFYAIAEDKAIVVKLPVKLVGHAPGVKAGGKMQINARKLAVKGLLKDIPEQVTVDVSELELEKAIKVKELTVENLQLVDPKDMLVCRVNRTRAAAAAAAAEANAQNAKKK